MASLNPLEFQRFVGRRIAEERTRAGYSQPAFAEYLGIAPKNLQRFEAGTNMQLNTLVKIANFLRIAPSELLTDATRPLPAAQPASVRVGPLGDLESMGWPVSDSLVLASARSLPVLDLVASGGPLGAPRSVRHVGQVTLQSWRVAPPKGSFVARVTGKSMEPRVPEGSYCIFRPANPSPVIDTVVLVKRWEIGDPDDGAAFALKRIGGVERDADKHLTIRLDSLNADVPPTYVRADGGTELVVIGEFVQVIGRPRRTRPTRR